MGPPVCRLWPSQTTVAPWAFRRDSPPLTYHPWDAHICISILMALSIDKREPPPPPNCTPISPSVRVCWIDLLVIFLILLVIAYALWGVPLTGRLFNMLRGKHTKASSSSSSTSSSPRQTTPLRAFHPSPRRQASEDTLVNALLGASEEKLDDSLSSPLPNDPFMIVRPSLNDSVLVQQGLVEETTRPAPTHNAYDVQGLSSGSLNDSAPDLASPARSRSGTVTADASLRSPPRETRGGPDGRQGDSREHGKRAGDGRPGTGQPIDTRPKSAAVSPPPPAYTPFAVGQGRRRIGSYSAV
ncbi:hypothetical protein BC834DRAFT_901813 [Gloeopeniophorella convolvens]|nr:hypothetical protein BC834DRAFT_901813 [Gloeopeniophorella convolvens]